MQPFPLALDVALGTQVTRWTLLLAGLGQSSGMALAGLVTLLITTLILFFDFKGRAEARGRSPWWGPTALLNLVGLIIVLLLKPLSQGPARGFEVLPAEEGSSDV